MSAQRPAVAGRARPANLATRQVFDAIVLGSRLGGALAGALLAKRGHRVLHVPTDGLFGRYPDGDLTLPCGPGVLPPLRAVASLHGALEELGLLTDLSRSLEHFPDGLQVLLPKARLSLFPEEGPRADEVAREFGDAAPALLAALGRTEAVAEEGLRLVGARPLPPDGFFERWALSRAAAAAGDLVRGPLPLDAAHPLGAGLLSLRDLLGFQAGPASPLSFGRTAGPFLRAPQRYPGGREALVELLRASIRAHGGDVLGSPGAPAVVEELLVDGGRFAGIRIAGAPAPYRARIGIATDLPLLAALAPASGRGRKVGALARAYAPAGAVLSVNLVLAEEGIPPGLADLALAVPSRPAPPLLLGIEPAVDAKGAHPPGLWTVNVSSPVGAEDVAGPEAIERAAARLRERAEEVLPFHDRHLRRVSVPALAAGGGKAVAHPVVAPPGARPLGVEGLPPVSPIRRLLLAGPEVLPGLGLEGEILAGVRAAEIGAEVCRKVDPLT